MPVIYGRDFLRQDPRRAVFFQANEAVGAFADPELLLQP
jgi:hypothetical protein